MKTLNQKELRQIDGGRNSNWIDLLLIQIRLGICPINGCTPPPTNS